MPSPALLRPLRERDFALLWTGQTISLLGDGIFFVAVAWQVYALTDDPTALSLVGLAWSAGMVAFLLLGGVASDRLDRRHVMIASDLVRAAAIGTMGVLGVTGSLEVWHLVALSVVHGSAEAFFGPSFSALIPQLVPEQHLVQANGLQEVLRPATYRLLGPAAGGLLVAAVGAGTAFCIDAGTFLASTACLVAIRSRHVPRAAATSVRRDLREGFAYVRTQPWLSATLIAACVSILAFWGPVEVLLPYILKYDLHAAASTFGVVLAAGGAGGIAAGLFMSERGLPRRKLLAMYLFWGLGLLPIAGYAFATAAWHLVVLAAILGGCMSGGMVVWATLMQTRVPSHLLGRVSSLDWFVSLALTPVSFALTGPIAAAAGADATLIGAGVLGCAVTLLLFVLVPGLRRDHERSEVVEEPRVADGGGVHADDLDAVA
jgi:DHA3 family tetracycline resistance protein-like MFS transporter